jgi:hypothetical protein
MLLLSSLIVTCVGNCFYLTMRNNTNCRQAAELFMEEVVFVVRLSLLSSRKMCNNCVEIYIYTASDV